jgi:hypothetical protein
MPKPQFIRERVRRGPAEIGGGPRIAQPAAVPGPTGFQQARQNLRRGMAAV